MTLVILAAGMGSRYGGLKQIDPITDHGEFIIDFSIYDAVKAGFDKVVFIIKEENYDAFRETVGARVEPYIKVEYAFQALDKIPAGFSIPEGREKSLFLNALKKLYRAQSFNRLAQAFVCNAFHRASFQNVSFDTLF